MVATDSLWQTGGEPSTFFVVLVFVVIPVALYIVNAIRKGFNEEDQ